MTHKETYFEYPVVNLSDLSLFKNEYKRKPEIGFIYFIYCLAEDKIYIGQTVDLYKRLKTHRLGKDSQYIDQVIFLYGAEQFSVSILESAPVQDLNTSEKFWIEKCHSNDSRFGYNKTLGGSFLAKNEIDFSQQSKVVNLYKGGWSLKSISEELKIPVNRVNSYLRNLNIIKRTPEENLMLSRKHLYFRQDENGTVLETYSSFSEIGKWAKEHHLTSIKNNSRAGMTVRYAILYGTLAYGYFWSSSWSEDEIIEKRKQYEESQLKKTGRRKKREIKIPSRNLLKSEFKENSLSEIKDKYNVSRSCLYNWLNIYSLDANGNDIEGWEDAPAQYQPALYSCYQDIPDFPALKKSLLLPTIKDAAASFDVSTTIYKKWLRSYDLPYTKDDIERYLTENNLTRKIVERGCCPEKSVLKREIRQFTFTHLSKTYGVSIQALIKWCRKRELPDSKRVINSISDEDWDFVCEHWSELKDEYMKRVGSLRCSSDECQRAIELYQNGNSIKAIAKMLSRSPDTISRILHASDIELRK